MPHDKDPRLSLQTRRVLAAFYESREQQLAGSDLIKEVGLLSGSLYPILARLEGAGWLVSTWEEIEPSKAGRPRKRLYQLTTLGERKTSHMASPTPSPQGAIQWVS